MNKLRLLNILLLVGITGNISCTKNTVNLPEPARSIEGTYEAQNNNAPFLIQGQTLQLNVERITADSVAVIVRTLVNGQAGDSLSYNRAYVGQEFSETINKTCIGYRVFLPSQQGYGELRMTCEEVNVFNYMYKPAGSQSYSTVKFKKI